MKANPKDKICGIYMIINTISNKVYIGKSKNIYRRIQQHIYDLDNRTKRTRQENNYISNAWDKYGKNSFKYIVLEETYNDEKLTEQRELYWMNIYNSTNRNLGYNLRRDSSGKMIVHKETSIKITNRLKEEWKSGKRDSHSEKLKSNWKNNDERKELQSEVMSKALTKYFYRISDLEDNFIEDCDYKRLKELSLAGFISALHQYKKRGKIITKLKYKNFIIEKIKY